MSPKTAIGLGFATLGLLLAAVGWLPAWVPTPGSAGGLAAERVSVAVDGAAAADPSADPLAPYTRAADLERNLDAASDAQIEAVLDAFPATPPTERLRGAYVKRLAAAGRWAELARVYREDDSVERQCLYLRALVETGQAEVALTAPRLEPLWLVAQSQPAACDPVFSAWRARGGLSTELVWRRIRLTMEAGALGIARHLGAQLPAAERPWLTRWLALREQPTVLLKPGEPWGPHPLAAAMLADGISRLARSDPRGAASVLAASTRVLEADPAAWNQAHAAVGRGLDGVGDDQGLAVWDRLSEHRDNLAEQEQRLRAGIARRDWQRVAAWVRRMPDLPEKADRWLYWQGRAEAALGEDAAAAATFRLAARQRSLWGMLAADRLGLPYALDQHPVPAEPARVARMVAAPAVARIRALDRVGRDADMRREWRLLTRDLETPDLLAAAVVADGLRWHDQAIFTLARTDYWDDLVLRFPLAYRELVDELAWQTALPEDWIYAVIRQESVFNPTVASHAGALGLMQLMPDTAREVAAGQGLAAPSRTQILAPGLNLRLGSDYLARMRDRFGHAALATAAYNAGPQRVARWFPSECTPADLWIVAIPFAETRAYVERVLAYRVIYRARLGLEPVRLSELLPPVGG
ncbi:transglycosylase SLT domain-containing protein [uncultured Lamprocystis sp.]|jgi:soluble lytic murein transglycosylase|uniref:transglycosylase SLT domain-containing protein n=1 Tax=uncultured Lamprocystis sp. TaxID=543132 RepID=UPI0025E6CCAC|nr:transglycosylase SLT domain-containing protein [uncultured Lamprocystis sp.]